MHRRSLLVIVVIIVLTAGLAYAQYPRRVACEALDLSLDVQGTTLTLTVTNTGDGEARLKFATAQEFDFAVMDGDHQVWVWSDDMMFAQVVLRRTLGPGERALYSVEVPDLPAGTYTVVARFLETTCGAETEDVLEVDYGDTRIDSGRFAGRIDTASIEVRISGVPDEIGPRAFRLSEGAQEEIDQLDLEEGDVIRFEFVVNHAGQNVIISIVRMD